MPPVVRTQSGRVKIRTIGIGRVSMPAVFHRNFILIPGVREAEPALTVSDPYSQFHAGHVAQHYGIVLRDLYTNEAGFKFV